MKKRRFEIYLTSAALNFLIIYIFFGYIIIFNKEGGFDKREKYQNEIEEMNERIAAMKKEMKRDSLILHLIKNDDEYLERYARENLNMSREGEIIFKIEK